MMTDAGWPGGGSVSDARCYDRSQRLSRLTRFCDGIGSSIEHYHHERNHQGLGNELIDRVSPSMRAPMGFVVASGSAAPQ
jgi:hypothetical protein